MNANAIETDEYVSVISAYKYNWNGYDKMLLWIPLLYKSSNECIVSNLPVNVIYTVSRTQFLDWICIDEWECIASLDYLLLH